MLMFGCEVFGVFDFFDVGLDLEFDGFFRGYFLRIFWVALLSFFEEVSDCNLYVVDSAIFLDSRELFVV